MKPEYVKVEDKKYKLNTDFRSALKCNDIAQSDVGEYEKALAIIYTLFGDEGLDSPQHYDELLNLSFKYLLRGEAKDNNDEPDMDFREDESYIYASFMSDYNINLKEENMHWYDYLALLNGLTEHCVLNRIRDIRNYDLSDIKDSKTKAKIREAQHNVALKGSKNKKTVMEEYLELLERTK